LTAQKQKGRNELRPNEKHYYLNLAETKREAAGAARRRQPDADKPFDH
jgi:hypothetical protein